MFPKNGLQSFVPNAATLPREEVLEHVDDFSLTLLGNYGLKKYIYCGMSNMWKLMQDSLLFLLDCLPSEGTSVNTKTLAAKIIRVNMFTQNKTFDVYTHCVMLHIWTKLWQHYTNFQLYQQAQQKTLGLYCGKHYT